MLKANSNNDGHPARQGQNALKSALCIGRETSNRTRRSRMKTSLQERGYLKIALLSHRCKSRQLHASLSPCCSCNTTALEGPCASTNCGIPPGNSNSSHCSNAAAQGRPDRAEPSPPLPMDYAPISLARGEPPPLPRTSAPRQLRPGRAAAAGHDLHTKSARPRQAAAHGRCRCPGPQSTATQGSARHAAAVSSSRHRWGEGLHEACGCGEGLCEAHGSSRRREAGGELLEVREADSELFEAPAGRGCTRCIPSSLEEQLKHILLKEGKCTFASPKWSQGKTD
jgi:hypothetical protein